MSQENLEIVRAFTESFNAGDIEGLLACCDPEIEFHSTFAAVGGADYHGHDGMRRWHRDLEEAWGDEIRSELEQLFDLGYHFKNVDRIFARVFGEHEEAKASRTLATSAA